MTGATGNIYCGLHEFADMAFVLHGLRSGDLFADIGANIGSYTILAASEAGASVVAFEPIPTTFHWLTLNCKLNQLEEKVSLHNIGLGRSEAELTFSGNQDTMNHVLADGESTLKGVKVPVLPLDQVLSQTPVICKIDVEGFETEVIAGASKTLADNTLKAIIIELNGSGSRYGFDESTIHEDLVSLGFRPYQYAPFTRSFEALAHWGAHNTIYIRDLPWVEDRVRSAPSFSILGRTL